jgi:hypothetical protein
MSQCFAELRTQHAVTSCHNRIAQEISAFFESKKLHPDAMLWDAVQSDTASLLIHSDEFEILRLNIRQIIAEELFACFNITSASLASFVSLSSSAFNSLFHTDISAQLSLIQEWRNGKAQTIALTQELEHWCKLSLNEGLHRLLPCQSLSPALEQFDVPQQFLPGLGLDSCKQRYSLQSGTIERLQGVLISLENRFIYNVKRYTAELFYNMSDRLLAPELGQNSELLEAGIIS